MKIENAQKMGAGIQENIQDTQKAEKKLKEATKAVIVFGSKLEEVLEDGKVTLMEGLSVVISTAPDVFEIVRDANEIKEEFLDLDPLEKQKLLEYVVEELDLEADGVEAIAEAGFEVLMSLDTLVRAVKEVREAQEDA